MIGPATGFIAYGALEFATSLPLERGKARNWQVENTALTLVSR